MNKKTYDSRYDWIAFFIFATLTIFVVVWVNYMGTPIETEIPIEEEGPPAGLPIKTISMDALSGPGDLLCEVRDVNGDEITSIAGEFSYSQQATYSMLIHTDEALREKYGKRWIYQMTEVIYFIPGGELTIYSVERR